MFQQQGVDAVGEVDGEAVGGVGEFLVTGAGNFLGEDSAGIFGARDGIVGGAEDERGDVGKFVQSGRGVVIPECFELRADDGRVVGEIVAEERFEGFGQGGFVGGFEEIGRHDDLQEGVAPGGARADMGAEAEPEHTGRQFHGGTAVGEGAEEREAANALAVGQGDVDGDQAAERMADEVGGGPVLGVHEGERVGGHLLDGDGSAKGQGRGGAGLAGGGERWQIDAAVVEGKAKTMMGKGVGLRKPAVAMETDALYKQHGDAVAAQGIAELKAAVREGVIGIRCVHRGGHNTEFARIGNSGVYTIEV
jgi:hypothetical protein